MTELWKYFCKTCIPPHTAINREVQELCPGNKEWRSRTFKKLHLFLLQKRVPLNNYNCKGKYLLNCKGERIKQSCPNRRSFQSWILISEVFLHNEINHTAKLTPARAEYLKFKCSLRLFKFWYLYSAIWGFFLFSVKHATKCLHSQKRFLFFRWDNKEELEVIFTIMCFLCHPLTFKKWYYIWSHFLWSGITAG